MKIGGQEIGFIHLIVGQNNMEQSNNPLIRFLDDSTVEAIRDIKESAKRSLEESAKLKKTLVEAQIRITQLLEQI